MNTVGLEGELYGGLAELTRSSSPFSTSNSSAAVSPALPVIAVQVKHKSNYSVNIVIQLLKSTSLKI